VKWLFIASAVSGAVGGGFTLWAFAEFDRVLKRLYLENHREWITLGMPTGFFWVPRELKSKNLFQSGMARGTLFGALSKTSATPIAGLPAGQCAVLRTVRMLAIAAMAVALICFALTVVAIFF
jgi:hypothetical protein